MKRDYEAERLAECVAGDHVARETPFMDGYTLRFQSVEGNWHSFDWRSALRQCFAVIEEVSNPGDDWKSLSSLWRKKEVREESSMGAAALGIVLGLVVFAAVGAAAAAYWTRTKTSTAAPESEEEPAVSYYVPAERVDVLVSPPSSPPRYAVPRPAPRYAVPRARPAPALLSPRPERPPEPVYENTTPEVE